jgi:hypothetical protein
MPVLYARTGAAQTISIYYRQCVSLSFSSLNRASLFLCVDTAGGGTAPGCWCVVYEFPPPARASRVFCPIVAHSPCMYYHCAPPCCGYSTVRYFPKWSENRGALQWLRWGFDPFMHLTALEEAEIIPGGHSDTRIKPLALINDHGRYIAVTPERTLASVGEFPLHI